MTGTMGIFLKAILTSWESNSNTKTNKRNVTQNTSLSNDIDNNSPQIKNKMFKRENFHVAYLANAMIEISFDIRMRDILLTKW
jgi:hypothetical protein